MSADEETTEAPGTDTPAEEKKEGMYFPIPDGLQLPDGTAPDSEVELMASFQLKDDTMCLKAIEGIPLKMDGAKAEASTPAPADANMPFEGAVEKGL